MSVPIYTSPGRSGFGPELSLSYDSGAGNGIFGFGWSVSLPAVSRKTDKGLPRYKDARESDVFVLSGAEDLVPVLVDSGGKWQREALPSRVVGVQTYEIHRCRPRIEGLFARIERWSNKVKPEETFWRHIFKDNIATWYGKTVESRIYDLADPICTFSWLICESHDDKGNVIVYGYKEVLGSRFRLRRERSGEANVGSTHREVPLPERSVLLLSGWIQGANVSFMPSPYEDGYGSCQVALAVALRRTRAKHALSEGVDEQ